MRWPKYWSFSLSIIPSKEIPGLISFRMDWLDLLADLRGGFKSLYSERVLLEGELDPIPRAKGGDEVEERVLLEGELDPIPRAKAGNEVEERDVLTVLFRYRPPGVAPVFRPSCWLRAQNL